MTRIDIFSGFLGAGKTTLIKKLITEAYKDEKLVLIENEFGDIGIDGGFLEDAGINITEMNSGCICCSLVGDFGQALKKVLTDYEPDRILIEPSGVGKLSDVIKAVKDIGWEETVLGTYAAVVDVNKCKMYMKNFGEFFNNQIENASTIILSHTTGVSDERLADCVKNLREHNSSANILTTPWEHLTGIQITEALDNKHSLDDDMKQLAEEIGLHHGHQHNEHCGCGHHGHGHDHDDHCSCGHHGHDHEHDEHCSCGHHGHDHEHDEHCSCGHHGHEHHHHADEVFTSFGAETGRRYTKEEITAALNSLSDENKYGVILRAKGIVSADDGFIHFDYVPGESDVRMGSAMPTGRLCVIGSNINENAIKELFGL